MTHQDAVQVRRNCDENDLKVLNKTENCNTEITPLRRIVSEMSVNCQIILRWDMQKFLEFENLKLTNEKYEARQM
jgi:hypothetical protein